MKSPYYVFHDCLTMTGLHFRFEPPSNFNNICMDVARSKPFPEGYECREPVFISSPKPRFYEVHNDIIVCQRVADLLEKECGNTIRLMPIHYTPDPQGKYPATDKYYFLWTPMLDCLEYTYGDPLPVYPTFRAEEIKRGRTPPETERPLLRIDLKKDVVADYPMFRAGGNHANPVFISEKLMKLCKAEKIYRMSYTPSKERLELIRKIENETKGLTYLLYDLSLLYGWVMHFPPGITREQMVALIPKD